MLVTLTPEEVAHARQVGIDRQLNHIRAGNKSGGGFIAFNDNGHEQHALGAVGELVVAKALGIPWEPAGLKCVDVGGYQVRATVYPTGKLIIRERDRNEEKFVLVTKHSELSYRVCGWISAGDAKQVGKLTNPPRGSRLGPAWFVDQGHLKPLAIQGFPSKSPPTPSPGRGELAGN